MYMLTITKFTFNPPDTNLIKMSKFIIIVIIIVCLEKARDVYLLIFFNFVLTHIHILCHTFHNQIVLSDIKNQFNRHSNLRRKFKIKNELRTIIIFFVN